MVKWIGRAGLGLFVVGLLVFAGFITEWWLPLAVIAVVVTLVALVVMACSE